MSDSLGKRYEMLSLRERGMVAAALLGAIIAIWDTFMMGPLTRTRTALEAELATVSAPGYRVQNVDVSDPRQVAISRAGELQTQLQGIDAQLSSTASGFVSSQRMIEVLHAMLDRQGRLQLVSIRNLPVASLVEPESEEASGQDAQAQDAPGQAQQGQAPFVHAIEIVIDGEYADILDYLARLEALPWKFRWSSLDLSATGYPLNRVRIQLSTLSMDATWLGV